MHQFSEPQRSEKHLSKRILDFHVCDDPPQPLIYLAPNCRKFPLNHGFYNEKHEIAVNTSFLTILGFPAGSLSLPHPTGSIRGAWGKKYPWGQLKTKGGGGTTIPSPRNSALTPPKQMLNQSHGSAAPHCKMYVAQGPCVRILSQPVHTALLFPLGLSMFRIGSALIAC